MVIPKFVVFIVLQTSLLINLVLAERTVGTVKGLPSFTCTFEKSRHWQPATNVHELTPFDIKYTITMGDNFLLPYGKLGKLETSMTAGGSGNFTTNPTLANILRLFNPEVDGQVQPDNKGIPMYHIEEKVVALTLRSFVDNRNFTSEALQKHKTNFMESWKLINIFVGNFDVCLYCTKVYNITRMTDVVRNALVRLRQLYPNSMVNLINLLNFPDILESVNNARKLESRIISSELLKPCNCLTMPLTAEKLHTASRMVEEYQEAISRIVEEDYGGNRAEYNPTFDVVVQNLFVNSSSLTVEAVNRYIDPNGFYFNEAGHRYIALHLWNAMLTPRNNHTEMDGNPGVMTFREALPSLAYTCPTGERPYFASNRKVYYPPITTTWMPPTTRPPVDFYIPENWIPYIPYIVYIGIIPVLFIFCLFFTDCLLHCCAD